MLDGVRLFFRQKQICFEFTLQWFLLESFQLFL